MTSSTARRNYSFRSAITMATASSLLITLLIGVAERAEASATLKIRLQNYDNPNSKDYNGACCDLWCISACDHVFKLSLDLGNSDNNPRGSYYWTQTTGHFQDQNSNSFGGDMAGVSNPIIRVFTPRWPAAGVKFKVWVTDDDSPWSGDDDVDGLVQLLRVTPASSVHTASWATIVMRGVRSEHKTSLTVSYTVYCDTNYYSSDCSVYCVASDSDSQGHYTCDPANGNIICRPGWEDESTGCKILSNDCIGHLCRHGATCVDGRRTYTCLCTSGYTGQYCERDIDDCAPRPCLNAGVCTDLLSGYQCSCTPEYVGTTCSTPYCDARNPCRNGGTCHGAGLCRCTPGFTGTDCSVDRCQLITCHNGGRCVDGACVCPVGIAGSTCDVIKCDLTVCLNGGVCFDGICNCPDGFSGANCETNIDECASSPCQNNGTCYDLAAGYRCACTPDYVDTTCSTPYCDARNPCRNGGTCHGAGLCRCTPGFTGTDCSVDRCQLITCHNDGRCVDGTCVCPIGVIGAACDIIQCNIITCLNGGRCNDGDCSCPPGFTGQRCETNINECSDEPCQHDGTCYDQVNGFQCRCLPGFAGVLCGDVVEPRDYNFTNASLALGQSIPDQPSGQMDASDAWFYASICIIFVLLVIIVILTVCLCIQRRRVKVRMEVDMPPEQPSPQPIRAVENDYLTLGRQKRGGVELDVDKLDDDDDDDDDDKKNVTEDDTVSSLYESIGPSSPSTICVKPLPSPPPSPAASVCKTTADNVDLDDDSDFLESSSL